MRPHAKHAPVIALLSEHGIAAGFINEMLARPALHVVFGLGVLALDVYTGPDLRFPILFVVPVALSAWFSTPRLAYLLASLLPLARLAIAFYLDDSANLTANAINAATRLTVLGGLAILLARIQRLSAELKLLRGMLTTCMYCKRIRNEDEDWEDMQSYIARHTAARFAQALCPTCMAQHHSQPVDPD